MDADEDEWSQPGSAPPEADSVALRALAVAALLRRLALEQRGAPPAEVEALGRWVEDTGLFAAFEPSGFDLFDAPPGTWDDDARLAVAWAAEELRLLGWALGLAEAPALFGRADAAPLLAELPASGAVEPFSLASALRPAEEIGALHGLYEALANAARLEAWAREVAADPQAAAEDEELEELLLAMASAGFERDRLAKERGVQAAAVEALRVHARQLLSDLFADQSPFTKVAFAPGKLAALDDPALAEFLATCQLRAEALAWLTEGDDLDAEERQ